ncbi:MAG TPA: hypothetical protein VNF47_22320 [Streptosporangiaceae bacterium]|nr:hypothetical protein [Streptosporangiaceae bacterium]
MGEADGRIVWHRKLGYGGAASKLSIRIDDKKRGSLWTGGTLTIDVGAGEHSIKAGGFSRPLLLRIEAGQEVHISSGHYSGMSNSLRVDRTISRKVIETERYETPTGHDEVRTIDNLQGLSPIVRTFRLAREWNKSYSIGSTQSIAVSQSVEFRWKLADIKTQAEWRLEQNYNVTTQQRQTFEDTVAVTAAPRTYSEIRFAWKEIRQRGYVDVFDGPTHISRTPFELVVGLAYDQRQIDRHSS